MLVYKTKSPQETTSLGEQLGQILQPGMVLLLKGELGAGKTCLAGGILRGLGIQDRVTSPTFTLVNEYEGREPVAHFDLYRLDFSEQILDIGFEEYLDGERIVLIEWPERAGDFLPHEYLEIQISGDADRREIRFICHGLGYQQLHEEMKEVVSLRN